MNAEEANCEFVELHQIVSEQLGAGWGRAVVRAEVQDGAGAIDFYVIASDGDVVHKTPPPSLTSEIFDWVYALRAREAGALMDWSVFVAQLTEHQSTNTSFLIEANLQVSNFSQRRQRFELTRRHWQSTQDLDQPRWYKMIVTVERSGKFNVEFEYKDDYQEGDIIKRG